MLYMYDNAICEDLERSFNRDNVENPIVKVCAPEQIISVSAQIKEGTMSYPLVALSRSDDIQIDTNRTNFTRLHSGVESVVDLETNNVYREKSIPIDLSYKLTVITTNTADMDELVRELMFKYNNMYFLTVKLPYEADRKIRFGVTLDPSNTISRESFTFDYLDTGSLYQTILSLNCEGCVLVHYTPVKMTRIAKPELNLSDHSGIKGMKLDLSDDSK